MWPCVFLYGTNVRELWVICFFFLTFLGRVLVAWLVLVVVSHVRYALSSAIKIRLP